ncbi:NIPSNAP family protein [Streptomyces sp. NPDC002701]|uniref:NIPSNAP family protein n=1 Tax=Streptomyces sp. NPDC002701 TaxID=3364661 RepID=UPI0036B73D28
MFYEIRTERARPGHGTELARYMDETVIPLHQEMGMRVVGAFTAADDEDAFVWIRRFEDAADRERVLAAVHGHPGCPSLVDDLSALSDGPASTVRLEPTPRSGLR